MKPAPYQNYTYGNYGQAGQSQAHQYQSGSAYYKLTQGRYRPPPRVPGCLPSEHSIYNDPLRINVREKIDTRLYYDNPDGIVDDFMDYYYNKDYSYKETNCFVDILMNELSRCDVVVHIGEKLVKVKGNEDAVINIATKLAKHGKYNESATIAKELMGIGSYTGAWSVALTLMSYREYYQMFYITSIMSIKNPDLANEINQQFVEKMVKEGVQRLVDDIGTILTSSVDHLLVDIYKKHKAQGNDEAVNVLVGYLKQIHRFDIINQLVTQKI